MTIDSIISGGIENRKRKIKRLEKCVAHAMDVAWAKRCKLVNLQKELEAQRAVLKSLEDARDKGFASFDALTNARAR